LTQPTSIEDWEREIARWPDSHFRPSDDGPHRIAVFFSSDPRDHERARDAAIRNPDRYTVQDTPAARALNDATGLSDKAEFHLRRLIETKTAIVASGRVEIYGAHAAADPDFIRYQVSPLLGRETVTHINRVPAMEVIAATPGAQLDALFATELIRDKAEGVLDNIERAGNLYAGGQRAPAPALRPAYPETPPHIMALVKEFLRAMDREEFRREAALARERKEREREQGPDRSRPDRGH
jgi:hypothetical protein